MGMSIDEVLEYLTDFSIYSPYQEAIDKVSAYIEQMQADYEARLKADMVAMLENLKKEMNPIKECEQQIFEKECWNFARKCQDVIQQKINELKAESEYNK